MDLIIHLFYTCLFQVATSRAEKQVKCQKLQLPEWPLEANLQKKKKKKKLISMN